ncbi:MAG: hypothetical protein H7246_03610 [Phycisphaerae bacterium]|nr:hypothetical protein [Saprospiraceae bacterium]
MKKIAQRYAPEMHHFNTTLPPRFTFTRRSLPVYQDLTGGGEGGLFH